MKKNRRLALPVLLLGSALLFLLTWIGAPDAEAFVVCGNNVCEPNGVPFGEDCETCPQDCGGSCTICGNGFCTSPESCSSCASDCGTCPGATDSDGDGVYDDVDNCINTPNASQADCDGDGKGDACDSLNGTYQQVSYGMCYAFGFSYGSSSDISGYFHARYTDTSSCNSPDIWVNAGSQYFSCFDLPDPYDCCTRWFGFFDCAVNYGIYRCLY